MQADNKQQITDALGNPIVIGGKYGYTTSSSGWQEVVVAEVVGINEEKGTAHLTNGLVKKYLYGGFNSEEIRDKIRIRAFMLFPVVQ